MELAYHDLRSDVRCLRLSGRLDLDSVGWLETRFAALACTPARDVVVDLSGVTFMPWLAMGMIFAVSQALAARRRRLVLVRPPRLLREALAERRLEGRVAVVESESAALRLVAPAEPVAVPA